MKYRIQVHFSGVEAYDVYADSLAEARSLATELFNDENKGNVYKTYGIEIEEEDDV